MLPLLLATQNKKPTPGTDPYWGSVQLLMHFDGDLSDATGRHTVSALGGTTLITSDKKFGTGCVSFSGATGGTTHLQTESTTDFNMPGDFTFEWWQNATNVQPDLAIINKGLVTATNPNRAWIEYISGRIQVKCDGSAGASVLTSSTSIFTLNVWQHVAITRQSNVWRAFVDGVQVGTLTMSGTWGGVSGPLVIGSGGGASFSGEMDEIRITAGLARYTGNFTVPTTQFPNQ